MPKSVEKRIDFETLVIVQRCPTSQLGAAARIGPLTLWQAMTNNWLSSDQGSVDVTVELAEGTNAGCQIYKKGHEWFICIP